MASLPYEARMEFEDPLAKKKIIEAELNRRKNIKEMYEKKWDYGKYVKDMYYPEISEKKRNELLKLKSRLKHKSRKPG